MSTNCSNLPHVLARSCKGRSIKQTSPAGRSAFKGFTRGPSSFWPWTWTHASSNDNAPSLSQRLCRKLSMKDNSTAAMWECDAEVWRRRIEMRTMKPRTLQPDYEERRKKHDQKNIGKKKQKHFSRCLGDLPRRLENKKNSREPKNTVPEVSGDEGVQLRVSKSLFVFSMGPSPSLKILFFHFSFWFSPWDPPQRVSNYCFFPRAPAKGSSEKKQPLYYIFTPWHLLIYIFTPSHLQIFFTPSHLQI